VGRISQSPQPQIISFSIIYLKIKEWNWRTWQGKDEFKRMQIGKMEFKNIAYEQAGDK